MTVYPLRGRRAPITGPTGASMPIDWRLHFIAGYLPPLLAVAALVLARRTPKQTA